MECNLQCETGQRCGFTEYLEQACFKDCKDTTCSGLGECKQVYGMDFKCECNRNAFLDTGDNTCSPCSKECNSEQRCGSVIGGAAGECKLDCQTECPIETFCTQSTGGEEFKCECPRGEVGDKCDQCDNGYARYNELCYKQQCGEASEDYQANTCSRHGTCTKRDDETHTYVCECKKGFDYITGCSTCLTGFELAHGECVCADGYIGAVLDGVDVCVKSTCIAPNGETCNNKGTCETWQEGDEIKMECKCAGNRDPKDLCTSCVSGYYEDPSSLTCLYNDCGSPECSNHGACVSSSLGKSCVCDAGFNPALRCSECLPEYTEKGDICNEKTNLMGMVPIIVICVVLLVSIIAVCAWLIIRKRKMSGMDEALLDTVGIVDEGQMDPMTKGLQLEI